MTTLKLRFSVSGIHCWPEAPDYCKELKNEHRHNFNFIVELSVSDTNRELEFISFAKILKDKVVSKFFNNNPLAEANFENRSCEMIAEELTMIWSDLNICSIEVQEDNENSGIFYNPIFIRKK